MLEKLFYKFKVARTRQALRSIDDLALKDIESIDPIFYHTYECFRMNASQKIRIPQ